MATLPKKERAELLPESVPVAMPDLPPTLKVSTAQQFKAVGDITRLRILRIIKHEPLTAKQLGEQLDIPPSTVSHHLQVLEAAGLAMVVARRLVHGIVAKYYTRTARLFLFGFPPEVAPGVENTLSFLTEARDELADALMAEEAGQAEAFKGDQIDDFCAISFPHARLSREHAADFYKRLDALIYEFATAEPDPDGQVYGFCTALFLSPPYLQSKRSSAAPTAE